MRVKINIEGYIDDNHNLSDIEDALAVALSRFGKRHVEIEVQLNGHTTVESVISEIEKAREGLIA